MKYLAFDMLAVSRKSIIIPVPVANQMNRLNGKWKNFVSMPKIYSMKTNEWTYKTWKHNETGACKRSACTILIDYICDLM